MFLRFISSLSGHDYAYIPGDVIEYDGKEFADEIKRLVASNVAEEVGAEFAMRHAVTNGRTAPRKHVRPKRRELSPDEADRVARSRLKIDPVTRQVIGEH
jgi:hypothetical protein